MGRGDRGATWIPPPHGHLPVLSTPGSTTTCSCGSPQTCCPAPSAPPTHQVLRTPQVSGATTSRCASRPSSWVWAPEMAGVGPSSPGSLSHVAPSSEHADSDSDEEDAQFFSVRAPSTPQPPASERSHPHCQNSFSTLVTVLKGRVTALCETKVRGPRAATPHK